MSVYTANYEVQVFKGQYFADVAMGGGGIYAKLPATIEGIAKLLQKSFGKRLKVVIQRRAFAWTSEYLATVALYESDTMVKSIVTCNSQVGEALALVWCEQDRRNWATVMWRGVKTKVKGGSRK